MLDGKKKKKGLGLSAPHAAPQSSRNDILSFEQQKASGYNFRQVPVSLICKAFWAK